MAIRWSLTFGGALFFYFVAAALFQLWAFDAWTGGIGEAWVLIGAYGAAPGILFDGLLTFHRHREA